MSKKTRKTTNWKFYIIAGLLGLMILMLGSNNASGMFDIKAYLAKILLNRIDVVIEKNLVGAIEYLEEQEESEELGGLVHVFQEYFPQGVIIGTQDRGETGFHQIFTDSDDTLYIGTSSDATFSIDNTGRVSIRDVNFVTSTLNWTGDFSLDGDMYVDSTNYDFYVDDSTGRTGVGTSTPSYLLELYSSEASTTLALTPSGGDYDARIQFNNERQTQEWMIFMDDDDDDMLKIATSSELDIVKIDADGGDITFAGDLAVTGSLAITGTSTFTGTLVHGGTVTSITSASTTLTAAQICDNSVIIYDLTDTTEGMQQGDDGGDTAQAADTLAFASSSDLIADCIPTAGNTKTLRIRPTATSTFTLTLAVTPSTEALLGGYLDLFYQEGGAAEVTNGEHAEVTFTNIDGTTTTVSIVNFNSVSD